MQKNKLRPEPEGFCPELKSILEKELALGNALSGEPELVGWPEAESVFAALVMDFKTPINELPQGVVYTICNDPHYGWYGELYCETHKHLLVSGSPKLGKRMWISS